MARLPTTRPVMTLNDLGRGRHWRGSTGLIWRSMPRLRNRTWARSAVHSPAVWTEHLPECLPSDTAVDATRLHAFNGQPFSTDHVTVHPVQTLAARRHAARRCQAWSPMKRCRPRPGSHRLCTWAWLPRVRGHRMAVKQPESDHRTRAIAAFKTNGNR